MISAKRMVTSFSRRGGREFANRGEKLTPDQLAYLENMAESEPIIAKMSSEDEWFARTKSHFVFQYSKTLRRVPFDDIGIVAIPKADALNRRIKTQGGNLDLGRRDGKTLRVNMEPSGPYFCLMNVLLRIAKMNRGQNSSVGPGDESASPTTDGQRPTTPL
jgi:hypothetical protein